MAKSPADKDKEMQEWIGKQLEDEEKHGLRLTALECQQYLQYEPIRVNSRVCKLANFVDLANSLSDLLFSSNFLCRARQRLSRRKTALRKVLKVLKPRSL